MWNRAPSICAYDWSNWKGFLIRAVWPKTKRIRARFGETPAEVAARLPRSTQLLLLHVNISIVWPFISDTAAFFKELSQRDVRVLNCDPPDIRKRTLQSRCRDFGLPTVAAEANGPPEDLLIVKTDLNSGGRREQLLSPAQRAKYNLPADAGRMKHPDEYFVGRRADLPADIWDDPTLVVERFVKNPSNRFFRVYAAVNSIVISEAYTDVKVKRMEGPIRRHNHFLWRDGDRIYDGSTAAAKIPPRLLAMAGQFLHRFQLEYGAVDVVESEAGEFYVIDLNRTPYWGREKQPGMLNHLHLGFSHAIKG